LAIVEIRRNEQKSATLRAGLVAASVYNVHRRKGTKPVKPQDFIKEGPQVVSAQVMAAAFKSWAGAHNRRLANEQKRPR
jgi:hypothetical protein